MLVGLRLGNSKRIKKKMSLLKWTIYYITLILLLFFIGGAVDIVVSDAFTAGKLLGLYILIFYWTLFVFVIYRGKKYFKNRFLEKNKKKK